MDSFCPYSSSRHNRGRTKNEKTVWEKYFLLVDRILRLDRQRLCLWQCDELWWMLQRRTLHQPHPQLLCHHNLLLLYRHQDDRDQTQEFRRLHGDSGWTLQVDISDHVDADPGLLGLSLPDRKSLQSRTLPVWNDQGEGSHRQLVRVDEEKVNHLKIILFFQVLVDLRHQLLCVFLHEQKDPSSLHQVL